MARVGIDFFARKRYNLYKKYAGYTIAQWVAALGIKGGETLIKVFA